MRIGVVGAGAIGLWIAAKLGSAGHLVSVLARGAAAEALSDRGAVLREEGQVVQAPVQASEDAEALGRQEMVVFAVKSPSLPGAAIAAQPLIDRHTLIVPMLNGVPWWFAAGDTRLDLRSLDPEGVLARTLPLDQVIGCVVYAACSSPEPGVSVRASGKRLICGEPAGPATERLRNLVSLLSSAGTDAEASEHIRGDVWYKLWGNITLNPISALTGATTDRILEDALLRRFILSIMEEVNQVGERIGCGTGRSGSERLAATARLGPFKTSMLQDAEAGRMLELDALLAAPRAIAAQLGVPTPHLDALFGMARLFAKERGLYPGG